MLDDGARWIANANIKFILSIQLQNKWLCGNCERKQTKTIPSGISGIWSIHIDVVAPLTQLVVDIILHILFDQI